MKKHFHIAVIATAAICLSLAGCGGKGPGVDILDEETGFAGTYRVEGPGYAGKLSITKAGKGYHLEWFTDDSARCYGKGLAVDGILGVSYSAGAGDKVRVIAYKKIDGKLSGLRAEMSGTEWFIEKTADAGAISPGTSDLSGRYKNKGVNPDGKKMKGKLEIVPSGKVWKAHWNMAGEYSGTGLAVDSVAVFAFTDQGYGVGLAVYRIGEERLDGVWTFSDYDQLKAESEPVLVGTEEARR